MRLQEIIVASRGVSFSSDLLEELCERGIRVGFLNSTGKPFALVTSPMLTATVEIRRAQLDASKNARGADIAGWIVAGKLHNQEKLMRYFAKSRDGARRASLENAASTLRKLRKSALAVDGESPVTMRAELMGLEGTGGRIYWKEIGNMLPDDLGFSGRSHQGATDAVNAAINYGYGILVSHVWGAVMNAGLEPFAGFLHVDRSGKPSLVLDLVEEFRPPSNNIAVSDTKSGLSFRCKPASPPVPFAACAPTVPSRSSGSQNVGTRTENAKEKQIQRRPQTTAGRQRKP